MSWPIAHAAWVRHADAVLAEPEPLLSGTMRSFNPEEFDVDDVGEPSARVGKRTP